MRENAAALKIRLSPEEVQEIRAATESGGAHRIPRHAPEHLHLQYVSTPELNQ